MKNMTWQDMVKEYPDRWVAVGNAVMNGPDIVSGDVVAVKTDEEICDYEVKHLREGLVFMRTTEGNWDGIIDSDLTICVY
mgnify:CR=1 FL=1